MKKGKPKKKGKQKERKEEKQSLLQKAWHFLWESKSLASWLVCLAICFLLVIFVFFPLAGFILSTPLPFVVVESSSMEHHGNFSEWFSVFGDWYIQNGINQSSMLEWSFRNGIDKGDIIVIKGMKDISEYKKGDVIVFAFLKEPNKTPIIHRIVSIDGVAATKGDNNPFQLSEEQNIIGQQILGKAIMRIPKLGWIKLFPCSLCQRYFHYNCCELLDKIRKV